MNKWFGYAGIPVSILLSYAAVMFIPYAFGAIFVGIPLMFLGKKYSAIFALLIGILTTSSLYMFYPAISVSKLSGILAQLTGMPSVLLYALFPLMFGLIAMVSALLFTGIMESALNHEEGAKSES